MGSFQSTHAREQESRPVEDEEEGEESVGEEEERTAQPTSDPLVNKSCAIIEKETATAAASEESLPTVEPDASTEDPDEFESCCDGSVERCTELAEFREELARKRVLRQAKMADIKQEMEQLRASLTEERSKNRALIRYIQSKEAGSSEPFAEQTTLTIVETAAEAEAPAEQSDTNTDARLTVKKDLAESQLQLQQANGELLSLQSTIDQLRGQIQALQTPSEEEQAARDERNREFRKQQADLADAQFHLQLANAEVLSMQTDISQLKTQIKGLKDVIKAGKEIINIREDQVEKLKAKLRQIEDSLAEREMQIMSSDLRRQYERQMANIRSLRELYEERERVSRMERDNLLRQLELRKNDLEAEQEKNKNLESHVASLQTDLEASKTELFATKEQLSQSEAQARQLQSEMTVVNRFISKFLLGMSQKQATSSVRLDKLAEVLAENRDLLIEMTKQEAETFDLGAFLPRALYDLVAEVDQEEESEGIPAGDEEMLNEVQKASPEQIADKLPKVWRVLIELVNHQERAEQVQFVENGESEECLKTEQTKNGPKLVVSVSKTYLKLKDLILEKKSLKKETNRLKTLNTHLERRLESQEKRLSVVSLELTKTWHLVGKMQRQHRQLHTQEQILRYHLQQKRRLLGELKEELEYCRLKWSAARAKHTESEDQWRQLKADFAARKQQDSLNASGESGYSDEQPTTDDEEDDAEGGGQLEFKKKLGRKSCSSLVEFRRSASLGNLLLLQVAEMLEMRKCHSESDMKSLGNVERANQFCNEKIEDLPIFPEDEIACGVKKKAKKGRKKKRSGPETAEEMFLRLAGLGQDTNEDEDEDDSDEDLPDDSECSEIEKIDQRESTPVKEPELTSEELFNMKREARLKRMAELNSRLDNYSSSPNTSNDNTISETDSAEAGPSSQVLTSNEQDAMQRRADRLERLEREAREFRNKLSRTVTRGTEISAQIDGIHNGFIARQSESPIPGSSSETQPTSQRPSEIPPEDLALLTDRERNYTQSRSERLQQLEGHSQSLLDQMNRSLKRGSRLTTQLDLLHRRYGGSADQPTSSTATSVEPQEQAVEPQESSDPVDSVLLENSIVIPPNGPIELILVSDEEILEEVDQLLPTPSNATSMQEEDAEGGEDEN
ncbi:restin homolog [Culex quinquefasciatus]|uniref:restin homolog n=1 Tax=Culex quinquefasciatus TaxID=7176 RepID=UPI0018E2EDAE|nr:restin homolog [Culex quinquefasciatus]